MIALGTAVSIKDTPLTGVVRGHGYYHGDDGVIPVHLVALDYGFWNESQTTFVSVMIVHSDNLTILEDAPVSDSF